MKVSFNYSNMTREACDEGVDLKSLEQRLISKAYEEVYSSRGEGWYGWCNLPYRSVAELEELVEYGKKIREKADNFVLFGIGGSALGPLCVASSLLHLRHNELEKSKRKAPRFYVEDNVDPERMNSLLDIIDISKTHFNFVTKSGETSETLSQFLIIYDLLVSRLGKEAAREKITITTTIGKGTLFEIAKAGGLRVFDVELGVGGRFSVLSNVGLVPFAVLGFDIYALLEGARQMAETCLLPEITKNPALMSAFLHIESAKKGKNICVMMPYADSLRFMSDFFSQLWGESLGKERDNDGNIIRCGQTPVKALGATDQHSQIQLYVEGPRDKIVTFLSVGEFRNDIKIPSLKGLERCDFLSGNNMSKLINSECEATAFALTKANCPNFTINLPCINENIIGQLLMYFMYQTAYAGALLNIDAFNQPGVEEGKKATFAILERKGFEKKLEEIKGKNQTNFIIE